MIERKEPICLPVLVLSVYLFLLPLSAGLAGLIGSISLQNYVVLLFVGVSILGVFSGNRMRLLNSFWLYGFWIFTVISMFWTPQFSLSWYYTTFLLNTAIYLFALSIDFNMREQKLLESAVLWGMVPVVLASIFNLHTVVDYRLIITIFSEMDPNDFGCGLMLIVSLLFSRLLTTDKKYPIFLLIVCGLIILLTGSRGAMLMFLSMFVAWMVFSNVRGKFALPMIILLVFLIAFIFFYDHLPEFLAERLDIGAIMEGKGTGRLKIWAAALKKFTEFSPLQMLLGTGYGSFPHTVQYYYSVGSVAYESHNFWVNTLIETGAVGLVLLVMLFVNAYLVARRRRNYWGMLALIGLAVAGSTLDMQAFRIFPMAFFVAIFAKGREEDEFDSEELQR